MEKGVVDGGLLSLWTGVSREGFVSWRGAPFWRKPFLV